MKILLACCVIDYNQRGTTGNGFVPSLISTIQEWDGPPGSLKYYEVWRVSLEMAQDQCVRYALANDYTHLLFVEDDTTAIPSGAIRKLVDHKKDVVAAYSYARHFPHFPTIFRKGSDESWTDFLGPTSILVTPKTGLREVDMVPFQFTLIDLEVFGNLKEPWFKFFPKINGYGATDQFFAERCIEAGVKLWCDTDLIVQHAGVDAYSAGFYVWKHNNPDSQGIWMPAGSVPFLRSMGIDAVAEENPNVHSEMFQVQRDSGGD